MAKRYLSPDLAFHHSIVTEQWYPFIVQQVRRVDVVALPGADKRAMVVEAARGRFHAKGLPLPPIHDLHLAIEYAVRDHAH